MHMENIDGQSRENTVNTEYLSASSLRARIISELSYMTPGHLASSSWLVSALTIAVIMSAARKAISLD